MLRHVLLMRCCLPSHPPPCHTPRKQGNSHRAKLNRDNALHIGDRFLGLTPNKMRIIIHIQGTKILNSQHYIQKYDWHSLLVLFQHFWQEMDSHSPSGTFFLTIPAHKKIGLKWLLGVSCSVLFLSDGMLFSIVSTWELSWYKFTPKNTKDGQLNITRCRQTIRQRSFT